MRTDLSRGGDMACAIDVRSTIHRLGNFGEGGRVQPGTESVEMLEAHDQRPPCVGVHTVRIAVEQDAVMEMNALDADLDRYDASVLGRVGLGDAVDRLHDRLHLHLAFRDSRGPERF